MRAQERVPVSEGPKHFVPLAVAYKEQRLAEATSGMVGLLRPLYPARELLLAAYMARREELALAIWHNIDPKEPTP